MVTRVKRLKRYCSKYWEIENYDKAVNDKTTIWVCHHRAEIETNGVVHSMNYLIENNLYYHQNPEDLIFLTQSEHITLHNLNPTDETRNKISNSIKLAKENVSDETKRKISASKKGRFTKRSSEFSKLFYSHFGIVSQDDMALYMREKKFYKLHKKFSDEV